MAAGSMTSVYGPPPGLARLPAAAELPALAKPGPAPDSGFWSRLDDSTAGPTRLTSHPLFFAHEAVLGGEYAIWTLVVCIVGRNTIQYIFVSERIQFGR